MQTRYYRDPDPFLAQRRTTSRFLGAPLALAFCLHVAGFTLTNYLPELVNRKPLIEEIEMVSLVSLPAPVAEVAPPPPAPEVKPAPEPETPPEPAAVPIEPEVSTPPPKVVEAKPVSLRPLKRKIKKAKDTRLAEEKERQRLEQARRLAEQQRRELEQQRALAAAREEERKADEAARRAREELASVLRMSASSLTAPSSASSSSGTSDDLPLAVTQYYKDIESKIKRNWALPEMRKWDNNLETFVGLTIRRDGTVTRTELKQKSGDPVFDRFVISTIESASPLPRVPAEIKEEYHKVTIMFSPGSFTL